MTWQHEFCLRKAGLLLALSAFFGGACLPLLAGDAIVFGSQKTKVEPGKDKTPTQNPFRLDKMTTPAPFQFDGMTAPILPNTTPRKDKRQQNAEDERKNWLFLDKGELQDKDDEKAFMGIRDNDDLSGLDKDKDNHDYTFRDSQSSRTPIQLRAPNQSQSRSPSQRRKAEANQAAQPREEEETSDTKRASRSSAIVFGSQADGRGGQELDLKKLLDSKSTGRSSGKSDFSLRDLVTGGDSDWGRDQRSRNTESFKQLLGSSPSSGGLGDAFGSRSDFTRPSINPAAPYSMGDPTRKSPAMESIAARQTLGQPNAPASFLSSPDASSRGTGLTPPTAPGGWRATPVEWPKSRF
jgi:hypothetical protein